MLGLRAELRPLDVPRGRRVRLRDDVPGARRGSGPAGAADAPPGEGPCRTSSFDGAVRRRRRRRSTITRGRRGDRRGDRGAAGARGREARWCSRCACPGEAATIWLTLKPIVDLSALGPPGAAQAGRHRPSRRHPGAAAGDRRRGAGEAVVPDLHARHGRGAGAGGGRRRAGRVLHERDQGRAGAGGVRGGLRAARRSRPTSSPSWRPAW